MKIDIVMPQLGQSIAEGTVVRWVKQLGDPVRRDETVLEVSTDKVESEVPSPADGRLAEILVEGGATVAVGTPIARLETESSATIEPATSASQEPQSSEARPARTSGAASGASASGASGATASQATAPARSSEGRFYSPAVRRLAREAGLATAQLDGLPGTGAGGRLTKEDLARHLEASSPAPSGTAPLAETLPVDGEFLSVPMDSMRKAIAAHMVHSVHTSPHVTTVQEADLTRVMRFRQAEKEAFERAEGFGLTILPFVASVVARSLREHPWVNASVDGDRILVHRRVHLGIAVALERGLVVPVVQNADTLSVRGLARAIHDLAVRARAGELAPGAFQGATFTITNPGIFGSLIGTPIISQPQVAILSTGAIQKRAVVVDDDAIAVRSMMYLSLSYDHRLIDGALAGRFTRSVVEGLESPDLVRSL